MSDRIPSDHATIESHRVHLTSVGRTRRLQVELPAELDCEPDDIISLSLGGDSFHAMVTTGFGGDATVRDAYPTRKLARERQRDSENRFREWLDGHGLTAGDPLALDVLRAGYAYGLRRPGERVIYSPPEPPNSTLTDIARDIDG